MTYPSSAFLLLPGGSVPDQGNTNMCTFYADAKALNIVAERAGKEGNFSPSYLGQKCKEYQGYGGDVGATLWTHAEVLKRSGICRLTDFDGGHDWGQVPDLTAELKAQLLAPIFFAPMRIGDEGTTAAIKHCICSGYPVVGVFTLSRQMYTEISGKPWRQHVLPVATGSSFFEHAMTFVGYDDAARCFLLANSAGSWAGDQGFVGCSYDNVEPGPLRVLQQAWIHIYTPFTPKPVDGYMPAIATLNAAEMAEARAALKARWLALVGPVLPPNPSIQQIIDALASVGGTDRILEIFFEKPRGTLRALADAPGSGLVVPITFYEAP